MMLAYSSEEFSGSSVHVFVNGLADGIVDDIEEFRSDITSHSKSSLLPDSPWYADNGSVCVKPRTQKGTVLHWVLIVQGSGSLSLNLVTVWYWYVRLRTAGSSQGLPTICKPSGRPFASKPQGTLMAHRNSVIWFLPQEKWLPRFHYQGNR